MIKPKSEFMQVAIDEALNARKQGDYAIGAVIVKGDQIIARAGNESRQLESFEKITHAEAIALLEARKKLKTKDLLGCVLYTTHEPCPMCAGVAVFARISGVVFGAKHEDMKEFQKGVPLESNFHWRTIDISCEDVFQKGPESIEVIKEFMRDECLKLFHVN